MPAQPDDNFAALARRLLPRHADEIARVLAGADPWQPETPPDDVSDWERALLAALARERALARAGSAAAARVLEHAAATRNVTDILRRLASRANAFIRAGRAPTPDGLRLLRQVLSVALIAEDWRAVERWSSRLLVHAPDDLTALLLRAEAHLLRGEIAAAEVCFLRVKAIHDATLRLDPGDVRARFGLTDAWEGIGDVARAEGKLREAAEAYGRWVAIAEELVRNQPTNPEWREDLAHALRTVGDLASERGELRLALDTYRRARALVKELLDAAPGDGDLLFAHASSRYRAASVLLRVPDHDAARAEIVQGLEEANRLVAIDGKVRPWVALRIYLEGDLRRLSSSPGPSA